MNFLRVGAFQHFVEVDMGGLGPVAAGDLDRFVAQTGQGIQHFLKGHVAQTVGIEAESHVR